VSLPFGHEIYFTGDGSDILLSAKTGDSVARCFCRNRVRPMFRKSAWLVLLLIWLVFGARGKAASVFPPDSASSRVLVTSRFAIADFDGDSLPDLASVEIGQIGTSRARYWIGFQMSAGAHQRIGVTAPVGGLEIATRDVNGDNRVDLIVTTTWLNRTVAILLNDGHGNFTLTDPASFSAAISNVGCSWTPPGSQVKDAFVALLSRSSGDCALDQRSSPALIIPESPAAEVRCQRPVPFGVSVLGRAPPLFIHHV
jgi:hypothetical protein